MQRKYTHFADIPQFIAEGSWQYDASPAFLVRFIEEQEAKSGLVMEPDFHMAENWTEEQQVEWLEYFLRGGKEGLTVYLNCPSWNKEGMEGPYSDFVCVDGFQRYMAIKRFLEGKICVFGSFYDEFDDACMIRNKIRININDLQTKEEVLQWCIDLNSGKTLHAEHETRNLKWMLVRERQDAAIKDFRERVTGKLVLAFPGINRKDLCFFQDNSGYRCRIVYHPESLPADTGAFSVCLETSGKIRLFGNMQALVPTVRTFKNVDDFEENL